MTKEIGLVVGGQPVVIDYFVQGFLDHTVRGMLAGLEGSSDFGDIRDARVVVHKDSTEISINGHPVPVNPFVARLVGNTIRGMVSSLKGVGDTSEVSVAIRHSL